MKQKRQKRRSYALVLLFLIAITGCAGIKEIAGSIDKAGQELTKSAEHLKKGLEGIDPIGLQKLLNENEKLRQALQSVNKRIEGLLDGTGVEVLKDRKVEFVVMDYSGDLRVEAWIDSQPVALRRRFNSRELELPVNLKAVYNTTFREIADGLRMPGSQEMKIKMAKLALLDNPDELFKAYQIAINRSFVRYMRTAQIQPGDDRDFALHNSLLESGKHVIHYRVTPIGYNDAKRWSIRMGIRSGPIEGKGEISRQFDLDSELHPNSLNQSIEGSMTIWVRTSSD